MQANEDFLRFLATDDQDPVRDDPNTARFTEFLNEGRSPAESFQGMGERPQEGAASPPVRPDEAFNLRLKSSQPPPKRSPLWESFKEGVEASTSGNVTRTVLNDHTIKEAKEDPGFWESLVHSAGEMVGDLPFFAAGGALGMALGEFTGASLGATIGSIGGPAGTAVGIGIGSIAGGIAGTGFGAMALNTFIKESLKEYHQFQNSGGDLTFGEFLEQGERVASHTLKDGLMGSVLGFVGRAVPYLRDMPGIGKLFDTKYVGKPLEKAVGLGAEVATAVGVPAVAESRLPTAEEVAQATILFGGMKVAHAAGARASKLPANLSEYTSKKSGSRINLALADQLEAQNLAYPPIQELSGVEGKLNANNTDLLANIAAFDASYIQQVISKIDTLSPKDYPSAQDLGLALRDKLLPKPQRLGLALQSPPKPESSKPLTGRGTQAPTSEEALKAVNVEKERFGPRERAPIEVPEEVEPELFDLEKPEKQEIRLLPELNPLRAGIESISPDTFPSDYVAGEHIIHEYQQERGRQYKDLTQRYRELNERTSNDYQMEQELASDIEDFISEFSKSAAPNSPESQVLEAARRLRSKLIAVDAEGNDAGFHEVSLHQLMETNKSLKKIPNWGAPGDFRRVINRVIQNVDSVIERRVSAIDPELGEEYKSLNSDYRKFKETFDNKNTIPLLNPHAKPADMYSKFSGIDNFKALNAAIGETSSGAELINKLRRDVWTKAVGEKGFNARTEGQLVDAVRNKSARDFGNLMEFLDPDQRLQFNERVERVEAMRETDARLEKEYEDAKKVYEDSKAENTRIKKEHAKGTGRSKQEQAVEKARQRQLEAERVEEQTAKDRYHKSREALKKKGRVKEARKQVEDNQGLLVDLLKQDPAEIVKNLNSIEGINRLKEQCKKIQDGDELFKSAAKHETGKMFDFVREGVIESGRFPYLEMEKRLSNKEFRAKLSALNGPKFVQSMDELVSVSKSLSRNYKKMQAELKNDPKASESLAKGMAMLGLTSHMSIPGAVATMGGRAALNKFTIFMDKGNYTQEGISKAVKEARELKSGNAKKIQQARLELEKLAVFGGQREKSPSLK